MQVANFIVPTPEHMTPIAGQLLGCCILRQSTKPEDFKENYWFPTPDDPEDT